MITAIGIRIGKGKEDNIPEPVTADSILITADNTIITADITEADD